MVVIDRSPSRGSQKSSILSRKPLGDEKSTRKGKKRKVHLEARRVKCASGTPVPEVPDISVTVASNEICSLFEKACDRGRDGFSLGVQLYWMGVHGIG